MVHAAQLESAQHIAKPWSLQAMQKPTIQTVTISVLDTKNQRRVLKHQELMLLAKEFVTVSMKNLKITHPNVNLAVFITELLNSWNKLTILGKALYLLLAARLAPTSGPEEEIQWEKGDTQHMRKNSRNNFATVVMNMIWLIRKVWLPKIGSRSSTRYEELTLAMLTKRYKPHKKQQINNNKMHTNRTMLKRLMTKLIH